MLFRFRRALPGLLLLLSAAVRAQTPPAPPAPLPATLLPDSARSGNWSLHFQQTVVTQWHAGFSAPYSGDYSLQPREKAKTSLTTTAFIGRRLWRGAAVYFNPELAGGSGLSQARGIAGFTNGETFRIGDPAPHLYVARAYLRQLWQLGPDTETAEDGPNVLPGAQPTRYLALNVGKFSVADFLDQNRYSHDPRTQFLNWSLMSSGAWDYPANTRGYTVGAVAEWVTPAAALRLASTLVPEQANGPTLNPHYRKAHAETAELTRSYRSFHGRSGTLRLLGFRNVADMGSYHQATRREDLDLPATRRGGRTKYGLGLNAEQELTDWLGIFGRASWNDGRHETWAFTEIDQSASLGLVAGGQRWHRPADALGVAVVVNGLSDPHRQFLAAGGHGFMVGDGQLRYGPEAIAEVYYALSLPQQHVSISPDYQFVLNPGYNRDRGPVHVLAVRLHVAF